jgi:hypothetical protein
MYQVEDGNMALSVVACSSLCRSWHSRFLVLPKLAEAKDGCAPGEEEAVVNSFKYSQHWECPSAEVGEH